MARKDESMLNLLLECPCWVSVLVSGIAFVFLRFILPSIDTFDGAKPRFLNRGKKRRSVSTLSIPRASDRGVEWVDFKSMAANAFAKGLSGAAPFVALLLLLPAPISALSSWKKRERG